MITTHKEAVSLFGKDAKRTQAYLYLHGTSGVTGISKGAEIIVMTEMWYCASTVNEELVFSINKKFSNNLLQKYKIKESSFRNALVSLCKKELLIKGDRAEYKLNSYFFPELNGEHLTFTFNVNLN